MNLTMIGVVIILLKVNSHMKVAVLIYLFSLCLSAGRLDQCLHELTLFAEDHKLIEEQHQTVAEAVNVYLLTAQLMTVTGVCMCCVCVCVS